MAELDADMAYPNLGVRLILEAFRLRTARISETRILRDLRHDKDLLPLISDQLRALLLSIPADQHISYDVQGFGDQGTDIVVRLSADDKQTYVCFQVKSHKELAAEDVTGKLRQQHSESVDHFGEKALWCLVLAADVSNADRELERRLRSIRKAFAKKPRTAVIDPPAVAGFARLSSTHMSGLVTLTLRSGDDPVLADARADLLRHPVQSAVLIRLVAETLTSDASTHFAAELADCPWMRGVSWRTPWNPAHDGMRMTWGLPWDLSAQSSGQNEEAKTEASVGIDLTLPEIQDLAWLLQPRLDDADDHQSAERLAQRLPSAIDALIASDDVIETDGGALYLAPSQHPALFALAAEAMVKYDLSSRDLLEHLIHVLFPDWGDRSLDPMPQTQTFASVAY